MLIFLVWVTLPAAVGPNILTLLIGPTRSINKAHSLKGEGNEMKERQKREDLEKHGMKFKIPNIVSLCVCVETRGLLVMGHSKWGSFRGKLRVGSILRDPTKRAKRMEMGFCWTGASKSTPTGRRLPPRSLESGACNLLMSCPSAYEREPADAKRNCAFQWIMMQKCIPENRNHGLQDVSDNTCLVAMSAEGQWWYDV